MVNQNYVLYVNEKRILRTAKIGLSEVGVNHNLKFSIPEKHLICGMILKGRPIKGDRLKDFPLKPIEKYLFEFSNIHFIIPDLEYTVENSDYSYFISELPDILPVIVIPPFMVDLVGIDSIENFILIRPNQDAEIYITVFTADGNTDDFIGVYNLSKAVEGVSISDKITVPPALNHYLVDNTTVYEFQNGVTAEKWYIKGAYSGSTWPL